MANLERQRAFLEIISPFLIALQISPPTMHYSRPDTFITMWTYAHEVLASKDGGCMSTCRTEDVLDLPACQQVLGVLRDARGDPSPLPETLPDLHRVGGGLLLL